MKAPLLAACLLAWAWAATPAQAQVRPSPPQRTEAEAVAWIYPLVAPSFSVSGLPGIDADLQRQADDLAAEHLQRIRDLLTRRMAQEQAREGASRVPLELRGLAWIVNERAIWRIDSLGAEDDALQRRMVAGAQACPQHVDPTRLRFVIAQLQGLPAAERSRALALERERLARWGTVRGPLPAWPPVPPMAQVTAAVEQARRADPAPTPPLPASIRATIDAHPDRPAIRGLVMYCEAVAWWLSQPGDEADRLTLARMALMPVARRGVAGMRAEAAGYPPAARLHGVEGTIGVEVEIDESGRPQRPRIVRRSVAVPGIHDTRPIAFEMIFDDASLERVRAMRFDDRRGQKHVVDLEWRLGDALSR